MNQGFRRLLALATVFLAAFAAVFAIRNGPEGVKRLLGSEKNGREFRPENFTLPDKAPLNLDDVELLSRLNAEYAKLTEAVVPSVVSIDTTGLRAEPLIDGFGRQRIRTIPTQGQGSGVIVSNEGHIVTNHHVVQGQNNIQVTLHDGQIFPATLIGEDDMLDIAVIKIDGDGSFLPLKFGDSTEVRRGNIVFAIGNPFGLGETITQGIISAVDRSVSDTQRDLFQTDAAINPGNSGGPLVNIRGEIIGINSAIYTPDRTNPGFQGVGFSIPSNDVRDVLYSILERGRPIRGYLGVRMGDLNQRWRTNLSHQGSGAVVLYVGPDSPAEKAGLQAKDIVLSYDGERIETVTQLLNLVKRTRIGREIPIEILRESEFKTVTATIEESRPAKIAKIESATQGKTRDRQEVLNAVGLLVRDLTYQEYARGYRGVVVSAITPGSLSENKLQPGDLIFAINGDRIDSTADFNLYLASSVPVQSTTLQIYRKRNVLKVTLPPIPRKLEE